MYSKLLALATLVLMMAPSGFAQPKVKPANLLLKEAEALAGKTNRNVFIIFHASWCGWCHKMAERYE